MATTETEKDRNRKPNSTPKPDNAHLLGLVLRIAAAFNVTIGDETIAVYVEELSGYTQDVIDMAAHRTIREWSEASKMPTLAFILERCTNAQLQKTQNILTRGDKPADWVAMSKDEAKAFIEKLKALTILLPERPRDTTDDAAD